MLAPNLGFAVLTLTSVVFVVVSMFGPSIVAALVLAWFVAINLELGRNFY